MGGLVGGLWGLFQDPTGKERNELGSLGGYETGIGEGDETAASKYYQDILSGDPSKIASSLAPEISGGQEQVEQAAKQGAEFGSRSGGTAAATDAAAVQNRGNIINLEGGLQSGAASGAASLGSSALGQAASDINSQAGLAEQHYKDTEGDIGSVVSGAASLVDAFPMGAPPEAAPGASPPSELPDDEDMSQLF